jgi:hypothetical protein
MQAPVLGAMIAAAAFAAILMVCSITDALKGDADQ